MQNHEGHGSSEHSLPFSSFSQSRWFNGRGHRLKARRDGFKGTSAGTFSLKGWSISGMYCQRKLYKQLQLWPLKDIWRDTCTGYRDQWAKCWQIELAQYTSLASTDKVGRKAIRPCSIMILWLYDHLLSAYKKMFSEYHDHGKLLMQFFVFMIHPSLPSLLILRLLNSICEQSFKHEGCFDVEALWVYQYLDTVLILCSQSGCGISVERADNVNCVLGLMLFVKRCEFFWHPFQISRCYLKVYLK